MTKSGWIVKQLWNGPRWEFLGTNDEGKLGKVFPRSSAAKAWLIDLCTKRGEDIISMEEDETNPGCFDIVTAKRGEMYQYAIEGRN